ncbi:hypothetical protein [Bacillus amyloliquefaciens]|uniref:hypothetical protein n=1 Tax=Bacillus amyloliquefaciens TaxID=1390 RepID=UPI0034D1B14A
MSLYQAIDGQKVYEGTMVDLNKETLTLEYRVKTRTVTKTFDRNKIAKARLAIKF